MGAVKTQDIPVELRTWWKQFQVAAYRHDYIKVFDDFITMTLTQFCHPDEMFEAWHKDAMKSYDRKEKDAFNAMFHEVIQVFQKAVTDGDKEYFDSFGLMYETLSSNYKKSALGQFFTPGAVVDMLSELTLADLMASLGDDGNGGKPKGKRILDPCCGSGRMLFIAHVKAPGNYLYGIDIDPLCAKMSCLNMMMHGCVGEVVCGNGLWLANDWRWAVAINPILTHHGVPSLMKIEKDQSFIWRQDQQSYSRPLEKNGEKRKEISKKRNKLSENVPDLPPGSQLKIF